eukprot:COSAG04_NODE_5856_length_1471_cov_1.219388_2_plen_71_part_00
MFGEFQDLQAKYLGNLSSCMCPTSGNGLFLPTTGRILTTTVHSAYGPLHNRSVAHPFLLAAFRSKFIGEQ